VLVVVYMAQRWFAAGITSERWSVDLTGGRVIVCRLPELFTFPDDYSRKFAVVRMVVENIDKSQAPWRLPINPRYFAYARSSQRDDVWYPPTWVQYLAPGFLRVGVPLWLPLALTIPPTTLAWRAHVFRRRRDGTHCPTCRYDVRGLSPAAPCPECGAARSPAAATAPCTTNPS
jgi:hypothetical protein